MSVVVSIVIPVYKNNAEISDTIESCLNQTFKEYEILLVNNNASAETLAAVHPFVAKHPGKIRVVSESRQGACSARNRGIIESKGEYIALLDDDDMMYPRRLEAQVSAAEKHPEAALIHALHDRVSPDNRQIINKDASGPPEFWRKQLFEPGSPLANVPDVLTSVMFFRRETAIRAGLFDERFNPECCEDSDFSMKMSLQGPFIGVNESLVRYRTHSEENRLAGLKKKIYINLRNQDIFYSILWARYGSLQTSRVRRAFRIMRGRWLRESASHLFPYKSGRQFSKYLLHRSLKENPLDWKTWKVWLRTCYPLPLWPFAFNFDEWINDPLPGNLNSEFLEGLYIFR